MTLLALIACDPGNAGDGDDARDAQVERSDGGRSDGGADGGRDQWDSWCEDEWGSVLAPAASDAEVLRALRWFNQPRAVLKIAPDRVEVRSTDGELKPCRSGLGFYSCNPSSGTDDIIFTFGDRQLTVANSCNYSEDPSNVVVKPGDCVADGTVVVEGDLRGYDPAGIAPEVTLEGPRQFTAGSTGLGGLGDDVYVVGTRCKVEGGHYACPTVGFFTSATHAVVAGGVRTEVELTVANCTVEPGLLDVDCPTLPEGFMVSLPNPGTTGVIASYEGGAPYPCKPVQRSASSFSQQGVDSPLYRRGHDYTCPPAPGNELGRGTYHIVATGPGGVSYQADVTDAFDGCRGSREPVVLAPAP